MNLSPEQVAAAKAVGCAFFPATEMQVQRLTMQQRIFRVAGKPFLLSRDGSYYETAGTLRALIADVVVQQAEPEPEAAPELEAAPEAEPEPEPEPEAAPASGATAPPGEAVPPPAEPEAPPRRKRGRPRKVQPTSSAPEPEPEPELAAEPQSSPEPAPELKPVKAKAVADTARLERRARLARRRAGGPVPHWQTAGPARRGRLRRF